MQLTRTAAQRTLTRKYEHNRAAKPPQAPTTYTFNLNLTTKQIRLAMRLTQEQFAQTVGVAKSTVSSIEAGKRQPSGDVTDRVHGVFIAWMAGLE